MKQNWTRAFYYPVAGLPCVMRNYSLLEPFVGKHTRGTVKPHRSNLSYRFLQTAP